MASPPSPAVVLLLVLLFHGASAATHTVGGERGWNVVGNQTFYEDWAASQTFAVGDVLVFDFTTGVHTVANVTETEYNSCTNPSSGIIEDGPANITLETQGTHYFICTVGQHCELGQKVAVTVGENASSTPPSGPSGSNPPTSSPSTPVVPGNGPSVNSPTTDTPQSDSSPKMSALVVGVITAATMGLAALLL